MDCLEYGVGSRQLLEKADQVLFIDGEQELLELHRTEVQILNPANRHRELVLLEHELEQRTGRHDV